MYVLHIKNMVCPRCIMAVEAIVRECRLAPLKIELGTVTFNAEPSEDVMEELLRRLREIGFDILPDKRSRLVDAARGIIVDVVRGLPESLGNCRLSDVLSQRLCCDYSYLSKLFSSMTGMTLEKYYIFQRIERAKELLSYGELTLSQIADALGYSSVAHLSGQFKAITGMTPSAFRENGSLGRLSLDSI